MADYDIAEAFQKIEEEMIASMSRNLKRHLGTEKDEGINYSMWQAEQLAALNNYRKENQKAFKKYFSTINKQIGTILKVANQTGAMDQEIRILEAIQKGWKVSDLPTSDAMQGAFFKINKQKLDALIEATTKDMARAETALLRKADDEYRKIIFNSEVYYNTGAGTLSQCVDMATKDFLSRGISCIEYANGARVGIDSYASMALRTAQTRAYLQGESYKRDEWGVNTVIVNKRGVACPRCLKWVGRVYYDDVWGNVPVPSPAKYPLLSDAIAGGLYHPNCKDIHTTYFEGISTPPEPMTEEQKKEAARVYDLEQKQRYNERQIRKYKRLSEGSVDPENQARYQGKLEAWQAKQRNFVKANGDVLKRRYENEKLRLPGIPEPPKVPTVPKAPKQPEFKEITDAKDFAYGNYTDKDYIKWMDDYDAHNSSVKLSDQELKIVDDYTEGSYIALNDVSRYSDSELLKKGYTAEDITRIRKNADMLEGTLNKYDLDTDIVTHRFERDVSWLTGKGNDIEDLESMIGSEFTTKGFTSSGMLPNRFRFTGGKTDAVHFEIVTPKGTNGAFLSMSKKGENEFLYNRNTKFKVLDGGERIVKESKFNFKTGKVEEVEVKERFLKVQVIPDKTKDLTKSVKDDIITPKKSMFRKINGKHTIEDDIGNSKIPTCNPKFLTGGVDYQKNCGYCSAALEMRRRGFDVVANPKNTMLVIDWLRMFNGAIPMNVQPQRGKAFLKTLSEYITRSCENGARGSLFVKWKDYPTGHFFSWEMENGAVRFIDAQNGNIDASDYFNDIIPSRTVCVRWDNLEPADMIKEACTNRGGN